MGHDHFVRHMLDDGGQVRTEYQCTAPEDAPCRTICTRCRDEQREQGCVCDYVTESGDWDTTEGVPGEEECGREPHLVTGKPCNYLEWLTDTPDEVYNGEDTGVRGPGWQPIELEWTGDYYCWDYAIPEAGPTKTA